MEDLQTKKADLLLQEYHRAVGVMDQQFTHILQVTGIGFSAAGALVILMSEGRLAAREWVFWVAPLALDLLFAIVIYILFQLIFATYYVRQIEDDISSTYGIAYFHFQGASAKGLSNFRTGLPEMQGIFAVLLAIVSAAYIALVVACIMGLHEMHAPFWRLLAFVVVQFILSGVLLWGAIGTTKSLEERYRSWIKLNSLKAKAKAKRRRPGPKVLSWVRYVILPRPLDLIVKTPLTVGTAFATVLYLRESVSREIVIAVALAAICLEVFAKQATYIWNEILDMDQDKIHPYKKHHRFLLHVPGKTTGTRVGKVLFLVRGTLAVLMSVALAVGWRLWWMPLVVILVFVWHWLYERVAKREPKARLAMVSTGYWERATVGALTVMTVTGRYDLVFLAGVIVWISLLQCMTIANLWSSECECYPDEKSLEWFLRHNQRIQLWSGVGLVSLGAVLATLYVPANYLNPSLQDRSVQARDIDTVDVLTRHPAFSPLWPAGGVSTSHFLALGVGVVIAIGAMMLIRHQLLGRKNLDERLDISYQENVRGPCTRDKIKRVPFILRWYWLAPLSIGLVIAGAALDIVSFFVVSALAIPLIVTASSVGLTYKEINAFNDMLDNATRAIPWFDQRLFNLHRME